MNRQKRIIAINDISCFGKCSLSVALPILSLSGVETCVMPTAVLSTHTAFPDYNFCDLTDELSKTAEHWKKLNLNFDAIYTGYLGSKEQVSAVEKIIDMFPTEFVLVDPVMGDNGKLYDGFGMDFVAEMKKLLKRADIIVPNVTEASYLCDIPYEHGTHSEEYIMNLCEKLREMCHGKIVITGINSGEKSVGTAVLDGNEFHIIEREKYDVFYSGTGDVFASTLASCYLLNKDIVKCATISADFVTDCILETKKTSGDRNYGINFEPCMKMLLDYLK